jgi:hypothetical protein
LEREIKGGKCNRKLGKCDRVLEERGKITEKITGFILSKRTDSTQ